MGIRLPTGALVVSGSSILISNERSKQKDKLMPEPTWRNQLDGARPILRRALFYAKGRAVRRHGRRGVAALEVDVLTGGGFEVQPVKRKGRHTVTPKEVEGLLPSWSKTKKKSKTPKPVFPKVGSGRQKKARRRPPPGFAPPRLPGRGR